MTTRPTARLLCLGDSYTIGEGLPLHESYPYQAVQLLRRTGVAIHAPEIIAQTGWTTGELIAHLAQTLLLPNYDVVSLLIGVNNQYRGLSLKDYEAEFAQLLTTAIGYAGGQINRVVVFSIPDWGVTPFAAGRAVQEIAMAIDGFNAAAAAICNQAGVKFIDITVQQRLNGHLPDMLAADGLHPSGAAYQHWARQLAAFVAERLDC